MNCTHSYCTNQTNHPSQLCAAHLAFDRGIFWAYDRLVKKAKETGDRQQIWDLALTFRLEVLDACVGMACGDIFWQGEKCQPTYPYEMVYHVCATITRKDRLRKSGIEV